MSCHYDIKNSLIERKKKSCSKPNTIISKQLRHKFLQWATLVKKIPFRDLVCELGLKIKGFELAEQYFCTNFEIWKHEKKEQKKLTQNGPSKCSTHFNRLSLVRPSLKQFESTIPFLQTSTNCHKSIKHLRAIPNISSLGRKHICLTCNSRFPSNFKLIHHKKSCTKNKFLPEKPIKSWKSVESQLWDLAKIEIRKDSSFLFAAVYKENNIYYCHLFENCLPETKVTLSSDNLENLCKQVIVFSNSISYDIKVKRLEQNLGVLANLSALKIFAPESSQEIDSISNKVKNYISHIQIFMCFRKTDQIIASKVIHTMMALHLENNPVRSCHYKTRRGNASQVILTGKSTGIQCLMLHELIPNAFFEPTDDVTDFMLTFSQICEKIAIDIGIDLKTGFITSSSHLARLYFDREINYDRNFTMVSPPHSLHQRLENSCRYGVLQARKSIVHPEAGYTSFYELDFTKYFLSILSNLNPFMGNPMHFKREGLQFQMQSKHLKHHTFANILLSTLDSSSTSRIQYNLNGKEATIENLRVDGLIKIPVTNSSMSNTSSSNNSSNSGSNKCGNSFSCTSSSSNSGSDKCSNSSNFTSTSSTSINSSRNGSNSSKLLALNLHGY